MVVLGEVVFCCAGGEEGEVAGGGLGVVCLRAADGEEEFLDPRGGFRLGASVTVTVVIVGGAAIVFFRGLIWNIWEAWGIERSREERSGRDGNVGFFWDADRGWQGETWHENVVVACAAAFGGDDFGVVFCRYFVDYADEAFGPVDWSALSIAGRERGHLWGVREVGHVRDFGGQFWRFWEFTQGGVGETWFAIWETGQVKG